MHNRWDDYFEKNRKDVDLFQADEDRIWNRVVAKNNKPKYAFQGLAKRMAVACAVLVVVLFVLRHELMMQKQLDSLAAINKELAEKEQGYIQQFNTKWDEFKSLPSDDVELNQRLTEELELLDAIYKNGLDDIKKHGYNERAIVIMLDTYEKRIRIIERLINEKRKKQNDENKSKHIRI